MPVRRVLAMAALAFAVAACQSAAAPEAPAPALAALQGGYFRLDSAVLGRPLHIHVSLPENYAREPRLYPTVYLTDGDSLFPLLAPTHLFLTYDEPVPPAILVGVAYGSFDPQAGNLRHVDFSAPGPEAPDGAAAAYQRFLADELIPEIERRYRADPERRILLGQSLGGGFVIYSALTQPDLFWGRIASNPAFRPAPGPFLAQAAPASRNDLALFVASGERDRPALRAGALRWFEHWNAQAARPWALETVTIDNGVHAASIGEVYRQGMIWLFRNEPAE
jgi:uncharacterized protein